LGAVLYFIPIAGSHTVYELGTDYWIVPISVLNFQTVTDTDDYRQGFFLMVHAGTAYQHLFPSQEKNYL